MKRIFSISLIILTAVLCMSGCGHTYENGYSDGYDDGYEDGSTRRYSVETKIDDAYDEGYSEGFDDGVEAAAEYIDTASWAPIAEDSLGVVEAYFYGEASRSEALEAIEYVYYYINDTEEAIQDVLTGYACLG